MAKIKEETVVREDITPEDTGNGCEQEMDLSDKMQCASGIQGDEFTFSPESPRLFGFVLLKKKVDLEFDAQALVVENIEGKHYTWCNSVLRSALENVPVGAVVDIVMGEKRTSRKWRKEYATYDVMFTDMPEDISAKTHAVYADKVTGKLRIKPKSSTE